MLTLLQFNLTPVSITSKDRSTLLYSQHVLCRKYGIYTEYLWSSYGVAMGEIARKQEVRIGLKKEFH